MKKEIPLYPLVIPLFIVLSIYQSNMGMMTLGEVARPLALGLFGSAAVTGVAAAITRKWERGGAIGALLSAWTFGFAFLSARMDGFPYAFRCAAWLAALVLPVGIAIWRPAPIRPLNLLAAIVGIVVIGRTSWLLVTAKLAAAKVVRTAAASGKAVEGTPDIFYIVLDGYGRSDVLKREFDFDNASFADGLRSHGFFVARDSRANYCQTELSIGSCLNYEELQRLLPSSLTNETDRDPIDKLIYHNAARDFLEKLGYDFIPITTGFPPIRFEGHGESLRTSESISLLESQVISMTPLEVIADTATSQYGMRRDWINAAFASIERLASRGPRPRFVVCHILAPHPPFVFGPNGEARSPHRMFAYWDASDFYDHGGSMAEYKQGYAEQARYIDSKVLAMVEELTKGARKPVIIIQGDHGPKMKLDQTYLAKTDVNECFPNLVAILAPDSVKSKLYDGITPVNEFRILFSTLFGADLPNRPDRSWYSPFGTPYLWTEVTDRIRPNADPIATPSETSSRSAQPSDQSPPK